MEDQLLDGSDTPRHGHAAPAKAQNEGGLGQDRKHDRGVPYEHLSLGLALDLIDGHNPCNLANSREGPFVFIL
jgi:hypothetical protein